MNLVIGVDIGGTKIEAILFDGKKILKRSRVHTEGKKSYKAVLHNILQAIQEVNDKRVKAIGIGFPGAVENNMISVSPHVPVVVGKPVCSDIARITKLPVFAENDAKLFAFAEAKIGAAKGKTHVAGLTVGTGIGCGLILDGKIYRGSHGAAGEWGHVPYLETDYEGYAGGTSGLESRYQKLTGRKLTSEEILKSKDSAALSVKKESLYALARLLASIINSLNPEMIVLGGSVTKSLSLQEVRKLTAKYSIPVSYKQCTIVKYKISESAGSTGAALLALHSLQTHRN